MVPALRQRFNANYSAAKYQALLQRLEDQCDTPVKFRVSETPCFFPKSLLDRVSEAGKELVQQLVGDAVVAEHDPENVILMEVDPRHQKTLPDFVVTEKMLGIKTVCITHIKKEGRRLYYETNGKRIPIRRIYNRAIVDELERKGV